MTSANCLALYDFNVKVAALVGTLADEFFYVNPLGGTIEHLTAGVSKPVPGAEVVTVTLHGTDDATTWTTDDGKPADLVTAARILGIHEVPARGFLAAVADGLRTARATMLVDEPAEETDAATPDPARDYWLDAQDLDITTLTDVHDARAYRVLYAVDRLGLDEDELADLIEERGDRYLIQHGPWEEHSGILPRDLLKRAREYADREDQHVDDIIRAALVAYLG